MFLEIPFSGFLLKKPGVKTLSSTPAKNTSQTVKKCKHKQIFHHLAPFITTQKNFPFRFLPKF